MHAGAESAGALTVVRLDEVSIALPEQRLPAPLDTLTAREREVLGYLQAVGDAAAPA